MFQSNKAQNSALGTILAPEIDITGDINVSGNIIIFGKVTGDIVSTGIAVYYTHLTLPTIYSV